MQGVFKLMFLQAKRMNKSISDVLQRHGCRKRTLVVWFSFSQEIKGELWPKFHQSLCSHKEIDWSTVEFFDNSGGLLSG